MAEPCLGLNLNNLRRTTTAERGPAARVWREREDGGGRRSVRKPGAKARRERCACRHQRSRCLCTRSKSVIFRRKDGRELVTRGEDIGTDRGRWVRWRWAFDGYKGAHRRKSRCMHIPGSLRDFRCLRVFWPYPGGRSATALMAGTATVGQSLCSLT